MNWVEGSVFDRLLDGEVLVGTVSAEENGSFFWHRYDPESCGYVDSKDEARKKVENGSY